MLLRFGIRPRPRSRARGRGVRVGLLCLALLGTGACGTGAPSGARLVPARVAAVTVQDYAYKPAVLEIAAGTTVTWTNLDGALHTATHAPTGAIRLNPDGTFDLSGAVFNFTLDENGGSASITFRTPGTYHYFCLPHNTMRGTVIIR